MRSENKPKPSAFKVSHKRVTTRTIVANSPFAVYDYLGLAENPKIKKMLEKQGNGSEESVHFSDHVIKINRRQKEQKRVLMITSHAVYNIDPKKFKCKRKIDIQNLGLVISSLTSDEFILRVPAEYDYHLKTPAAKRDRAMEVLIALYKHQANVNKWPRKTLKQKWQHGKLVEMVVTRMKTQTLQAFNAVQNGDDAKLVRYIEKGADINETQNGRTCLHEAAVRNHLKCGKLLIAKRAHIDAKDNDGKTCLHLVSENGHNEFAKLLIKAKAEVDQIDYVGRTPLFEASIANRREVIGTLLCNMANVNAVDTEEQSAMHIVCALGISTSVRQLLQARASTTLVDRFRSTCRMWARFGGHRKVLHFLDNAEIVLNSDWVVVSKMGANAREKSLLTSKTIHRYRYKEQLSISEKRGYWVRTEKGWVHTKRDNQDVVVEVSSSSRHSRDASLPDANRQIAFRQEETYDVGDVIGIRFLERHMKAKSCAARVRAYHRDGNKYDLELIPDPSNSLLDVKHIILTGVPAENINEQPKESVSVGLKNAMMTSSPRAGILNFGGKFSLSHSELQFEGFSPRGSQSPSLASSCEELQQYDNQQKGGIQDTNANPSHSKPRLRKTRTADIGLSGRVVIMRDGKAGGGGVKKERKIRHQISSSLGALSPSFHKAKERLSNTLYLDSFDRLTPLELGGVDDAVTSEQRDSIPPPPPENYDDGNNKRRTSRRGISGTSYSSAMSLNVVDEIINEEEGGDGKQERRLDGIKEQDDLQATGHQPSINRGGEDYNDDNDSTHDNGAPPPS